MKYFNKGDWVVQQNPDKDHLLFILCDTQLKDQEEFDEVHCFVENYDSKENISIQSLIFSQKRLNYFWEKAIDTSSWTENDWQHKFARHKPTK